MSLAAHVTVGQVMQLPVDKHQVLVDGAVLAAVHALEDLGDVPVS